MQASHHAREQSEELLTFAPPVLLQADEVIGRHEPARVSSWPSEMAEMKELSPGSETELYRAVTA